MTRGPLGLGPAGDKGKRAGPVQLRQDHRLKVVTVAEGDDAHHHAREVALRDQ